MSVFSNDSQMKKAVFWLGLSLSSLILKALAFLAQKTKTSADDAVVAEIRATLNRLKAE